MTIKQVLPVVLLLSLLTYGQEEESFYQQELNRMVNIPNSPEAQAFAKYGDIDVSLYSGTPNISIPLHTIKGREMDLPMSLTYDGSGVKVEQLATWVGLGWNLNVGGRVTRMANGLPDDYIQGTYQTMNDLSIRNKVKAYLNNTNKEFASPQAVKDYFEFLYDINRNYVDALPDIYRVSAPGLSTTLVFDTNDGNLPKSLDNPRIKIQATRGSLGKDPIIGWKIVNEDGTRYFFDRLENTYRQGNDMEDNGAVNNEYTSSWLLTRIESANRKDNYDFEYSSPGYWSDDQFASTATRVLTSIQPNVYDYSAPPAQFSSEAGYAIKQQFPNLIKHISKTVIRFFREKRYDIKGANQPARLAKVEFFDYRNKRLKRIRLQNNDYFGLGGNNPQQVKSSSIRLKLNGLEIEGTDSKTYETYSFDYIKPDQVPDRDSKAQDYSGFYNGANNTVLYPRYKIGSFNFDGANRDPNFSYAKNGLLQRITYPTGGTTEFEFEGNIALENVDKKILRTYLQMDIGASDPTKLSLYLDENGFLCDDRYGFTDDPPKIKVVGFEIPETGQYTITYSGSAANEDTEAQIALRGTYDFSCDGLCAKKYPKFSTLCEFDNAPSINQFWRVSNFTTTTKQFKAGKYIALLVLDEDDGVGNYASARLKVSRYETVTNAENVDKGGVRIHKLSNYNAKGNYVSGKVFEYNQPISNYRAIMSVFKSFPAAEGGQTQLERTASYPQGSEPLFVYPKVTEYQIDKTGKDNGSIVHSFYHETKGSTPRLDPPYENNYFPSLKGGNLRRNEVVDATGNKVSSQAVDYFETLQRPIRVEGLALHNDLDLANQLVYIKEYNNYSTYEYLPRYSCPIAENSGPNLIAGDTRNGTYVPGSLCEVPAYVYNPASAGYHSKLDFRYSTFTFRKTFISGVYGGVSTVKDTLFTKDATNKAVVVATSSTTTYDPDHYYLPTDALMVDSKGDTYKTTTTFPSQAGISSLVNKNNLVAPIKTRKVKLNAQGEEVQVLQIQESNYQQVAGSIVLPQAISTAKRSDASAAKEDRAIFSYYSNGNLKTAKQPNGPLTVYLWGYNDMYLVAKIENATYSQVTATGVNLGTLKNLSTTESKLKAQLKKVRDGLPQAMVTTYTYTTGVGVSSITDPRGYTQHFRYDGFNRLAYITDAEQHVLKKYTYNYTGQQQEGHTTLGVSLNTPSGGVLNDAATISANVSGGTGDFIYKWSVNDAPVAGNAPNLSYAFETPGNVSVKMEVIDSNTGISKSATSNFTIYAPLKLPTVTATDTDIIKGSAVAFNAGNIGGGSGNRTYQWKINGTVQSGSSATFSKTFSSTGTYTVTFRVSDDAIPGHFKEGSVDVKSYNPLTTPTVNANKAHVLKDTAINFSTANIGGGSGSRSYEWYVDDTKQSGTSSSFQFVPSAPGTYTLKFRVQDEKVAGHYSEGVKTVYAYNPMATPTVEANFTHVRKGTIISFATGNISGGSGNRRYEWYVGDNKLSTSGTTLNYTPGSASTLKVKFKIVDTKIAGHTEESIATVYVYNPLNTPQLNSNKTYVVKGTAIAFTTANVGGGSGFNRNEWYINGVKQSSTGSGFNFTPTNKGTYTVKYRVIDTRIAAHFKETTKKVYAYNNLTTPNVYASNPFIERGGSITFTTSGIGGGSGSRRLEWYVNNSKQSAIGNSFTRSFGAKGNYSIKFRVIDNNTGQQVDRTIGITVYDPMVPGGISAPSTVAVNTDANFNITPTKGSGQYSYVWTVSSPWKTHTSTSKSFKLRMSYDYYGNRTISCKVTDVKTKVSRTVTKTLTVNGAPTLNGKFNRSTIGSGTYFRQYRITAVPSNGSGQYSYTWYVNGTKASVTANQYQVYLDCSAKSVLLKCEIKDLRTNKKKTVQKVYSFNPNCGGGGSNPKNKI